MGRDGEARPATVRGHRVDIDTTGQTVSHCLQVVGLAGLDKFSLQFSHYSSLARYLAVLTLNARIGLSSAVCRFQFSSNQFENENIFLKGLFRSKISPSNYRRG